MNNKRQSRKRHGGNFDNMTWDKEGLQQEVEELEDGSSINWTSLAKKYKITNKSGEIAKNGGQIAQEFLISKGVNIQRFTKTRQQSAARRVRRKKLRGSGGMYIT